MQIPHCSIGIAANSIHHELWSKLLGEINFRLMVIYGCEAPNHSLVYHWSPGERIEEKTLPLQMTGSFQWRCRCHLYSGPLFRTVYLMRWLVLCNGVLEGIVVTFYCFSGFNMAENLNSNYSKTKRIIYYGHNWL